MSVVEPFLIATGSVPVYVRERLVDELTVMLILLSVV